MTEHQVLVACEFSGTVRDAFIAAGYDAISCDLLPTEAPGPHVVGDIRDVIDQVRPELMIAHPPCTYLTNAANGSLYRTTPSPSGALAGPHRWKALVEGAVFFRSLLATDVPMIAVENPVMNGHAKLIVGRGPDQVVQPWMFGHLESKGTGLWLRNLPPLVATNDVSEEAAALTAKERDRVHWAPPGPDRWKLRSITYQGIADAMASQWGPLLDAEEAVA
jgi:hypothetical protein